MPAPTGAARCTSASTRVRPSTCSYERLDEARDPSPSVTPVYPLVDHVPSTWLRDTVANALIRDERLTLEVTPERVWRPLASRASCVCQFSPSVPRRSRRIVAVASIS
jgi:hypothetical protein